MRTPDEIVELFHQRQQARHPVINRMLQVRDQYNGDVIVPLPEMDTNEQAAVANLIQSGLDNYGMRIASVMPNLDAPPIDPRSPRSRARADIRKRSVLSWWEANKIPLKLRRRARHLIGYAASPVTLRPDFQRGIPRWDPRNPLACFPAPCVDPDDLTPDDTIHVIKRSLGYIRKTWPEKARMVAERDEPDGKMFNILEYDDADVTVVVLLGGSNPSAGLFPHVTLEKYPNRAGIPLTVVPQRITLDRPQGQFDGILGMFQMQAKLMALEVLAVQRGVFPDTYLVSRQGESAQFVAGPFPGYSGQVNVVEGGDIKEVAINPGFATNQTIDRLERAQRVQTGIAAEFGGESNTNIRTGRRGDAILSAMVDFPVEEAQHLLASSAEEENRRAVKIAKAYFGNEARSFHVTWKGAKGNVDYIPNRDFESDYTLVTYGQAGADVNNLIIGIGQRVGIGTMSKQTAMALDPWVPDAELESDRVTAEGLEAALLQSIQNQAAAGEIPPSDLARIMQLVRDEDMDLAKAVQKAQEEAQERQASSGEQGTPTGPVDPAAPEAQPGLAVPGMGAEAGVSIQPPQPSMQNLDQMLQTLGAA